MCDKCIVNNEEIVEQEELNESTFSESINEAFGELQLEVEATRLGNLCLFNEDKKEEIIKSSEFREGMKIGAKIAGLYSTLLSFGLQEKDIYEICINQQTIDHNLVNQKLINDNNVEVSKISVIKIEGQQI